jgi:mannose-6-phosphate isomerase-like protein (cupin superfamily)
MNEDAFVRRAETTDCIQKSDHPDYEFKKRVIVGKDDSEHFDVSVYEVPPGKAAVPYHYHMRNEEVFFILSGKGLLKSPMGEREVTA